MDLVLKESIKNVVINSLIIFSFVISIISFILLYNIMKKEKLLYLGGILDKTDEGGKYQLLESGSGVISGTSFLLAFNLIFILLKHINKKGNSKNINDNYNNHFQKEQSTRFFHWSLLGLIIFLAIGIILFAYDYFANIFKNEFIQKNEIILSTIFTFNLIYLLLLILFFISINSSLNLKKSINQNSSKKVIQAA